MQLTVRLIHETDQRLWQRLDLLYIHTESILTNQESLMATIKELVASVAAVKGKADSIGALITQLKEQITGLTNGNLPADVQAQVDQAFADAEAAKTELSAAVDNPGTAPASNASAANATASSTSGT